MNSADSADSAEPSLEVLYWPIDRPVPYENNPRFNQEAVDGVKASIRRFKFVVPILVDSNEVIITGHTRIEAARALGLSEVPVIVARHLSTEEAAALRLADNRLHENSRWDEHKLVEELGLLSTAGFDMEYTGFSSAEIDCLLDPINVDCLDSLSASNVCGDVEERALSSRLSAALTFGGYGVSVPVTVYTAWERRMLLRFSNRAAINRFMLQQIEILDLLQDYEQEQLAASEESEES